MIKKKHIHHKFHIFIFVSLTIFLLITIWWQHCLKPLKNLHVQQHDIPTLFIPGYLGNWISLGPMVHRMNHYGIAKESMVVHIYKNNKISIKKEYPLKNNPNILVLFKDNTEPNRQSYQLGLLAEKLYSVYHIHKMNLLGHSEGGNIIFKYLITKHSKKVPETVKFVNFADDYPKNQEKKIYKLPSNLKVLTIAGEIWNTGTDGEIPLKSALKFNDLIKKHVSEAKVIIFKGAPWYTFHSCLHQNPSVGCAIAKFLYN